MSPEHGAQLDAGQPDAALGADDARVGGRQDRRIGAWPLDEPFPALLTDAQLRRVFGISSAHFYALKKLGRFRAFEAQPRVLKRARYSGALVARYARGERNFGTRAFGQRGAV